MKISQKERKIIAENCAKKIFEAKLGEQIFNEPYEHLVIDDFFPDDLANICLKNFPPTSDPSWETFK